MSRELILPAVSAISPTYHPTEAQLASMDRDKTPEKTATNLPKLVASRRKHTAALFGVDEQAVSLDLVLSTVDDMGTNSRSSVNADMKGDALNLQHAFEIGQASAQSQAPTDYWVDLYERFTGRKPDAEGLAFWQDWLEAEFEKGIR